MEEDQDLKFVCKLCNKKFPCGKSLGGHMRSHVLANSTEFEENGEANLEKFQSWSSRENPHQSKFDLGGHSGYGLRENPKKTWRAVDSTSSPLPPQERVCQQCGKVFQSMKALCGHMACHSEKLVMDSHSDTETDEEEEEPNLRNRSSKTKRDSGNWNGVNSVVESSDNNSVVLETKSSSTDMKFGRKDKLKCVYNQKETPRIKKREERNLKLSVLDVEAESESSDSGYFLDENTIVESDISVDRNGNSKWSTSQMSHAVWCDESVIDKGKGLNTTKKTAECEFDDYPLASYADKCEPRKRMKDSSYHPELGNKSFKKIKLGPKSSEGCKTIQNKKYECLNCKKSFNSYQALGGHRPCHKKTNAYLESINGTGESSVDANCDDKQREAFSNSKPASGAAKDLSYNPEKKIKPKKSKGHECPFCDRVFKSGQALGGHKRSHFIVGTEQNMNQSSAVKKVDDLFDLNLPAPVDDDDDEHAHLMSW